LFHASGIAFLFPFFTALFSAASFSPHYLFPNERKTPSPYALLDRHAPVLEKDASDPVFFLSLRLQKNAALFASITPPPSVPVFPPPVPLTLCGTRPPTPGSQIRCPPGAGDLGSISLEITSLNISPRCEGSPPFSWVLVSATSQLWDSRRSFVTASVSLSGVPPPWSSWVFPLRPLFSLFSLFF